MIELNPNECRVLGVLIEKAQTTPQQYPMTLNGLVSGCNQKNNRNPVTDLDEDAVFDALDGLRARGLSRQVELSGSRVAKYRHVAREALDVDTNQLVVLAELLLRGPQTLGELRGRASRMHTIESVDAVQNILQSLKDREEPLVKRLPPAPGSRAERYQQLLCPDLHPVEVGSAAPGRGAPRAGEDDALAARVDALERKVAELADTLQRIETALGGG